MTEKVLIEEMEREVSRLKDNAEREEALAHEAHVRAREMEDEAEELSGELKELENEAERGGDASHQPHRECVSITMVVNGVETLVEAGEEERLAEVRQKALDETKNLARPPEDWEIKDEGGHLLDPEREVGSFHFGQAVTLYVSLKAGVQGAG